MYGDLAKPGVKQVGVALETVIGLGNTILWPIAWANARSRIALEKNLEKYRKEMEAVPEEKVVGVAPEIGVPVTEKLAYVSDEQLANLYIKLLATASNQDTLSNAHPSFVNVINNMSPDEAVLLKNFVTNDTMPFVTAQAQWPNGVYSTISGSIVSQRVLSSLSFPLNIDVYLSNLAGLGLVEIRDDKWLSDDNLYEPLRNLHKAELGALVASKYEGRRLDFGKGGVTCTPFGYKFIAACHVRED